MYNMDNILNRVKDILRERRDQWGDYIYPERMSMVAEALTKSFEESGRAGYPLEWFPLLMAMNKICRMAIAKPGSPEAYDSAVDAIGYIIMAMDIQLRQLPPEEYELVISSKDGETDIYVEDDDDDGDDDIYITNNY